MVAQITRRFSISYQSNVRAKLHDFWRRSVWGYLLAALVLAAAQPGLLGSFWLTAGGCLVGFCALGLGVVYLGAYVQRHKLTFNATVTFQESQILVRPDAPGQLPETHTWRWILAWQESATHFFLRIRRFPQLFLLVRKTELTPSETATLRTWLARPRPAAA